MYDIGGAVHHSTLDIRWNTELVEDVGKWDCSDDDPKVKPLTSQKQVFRPYWNASVSRAHKGLFSLVEHPTLDPVFSGACWYKCHLPAIDCLTELSDARLRSSLKMARGM